MPRKKQFDDEVAMDLNLEERLDAYLNHNYEVREEDQEWLEAVDVSFRIIYQADDLAKARKLLHRQFKDKNISHLVQLTISVYGDFFEVNKMAMRIIQEKRYRNLIRQAEQAGEWEYVDRILARIDRLFGLYDQNDEKAVRKMKLPKVGRSSDPAVLEKQIDADAAS